MIKWIYLIGKGMKKMIAVIDYGAGNLQSVVKALEFIGCKHIITSSTKELLKADGAILPGVGSFGDAMDCMVSSGCAQAVVEFVKSGKPLLGICLGLQLLFEASEESPGVKGLGLLKGTISRIPNADGALKIPHMGWNSLNIVKHDGIFEGIKDEPYVYFVHSYYLRAEDSSIVSSRTEYGVSIDASVSCKNIHAAQFHPEKSGAVGLQMLRNFAAMTQRGE